MFPGDAGQALGEGGLRLGIDSRQRLGDGAGRIADGQADSPGPRIHRQHAAYGPCDGDGDGVADPWEAADAAGAFDSTT